MTTTGKQRLRNVVFGVILFLAASLLGERGEAQDSCADDLSGLKNISFRTSSLKCIQAWSTYNYILRYSTDTSTNVVSIVLSTLNDGSWHGIGFSRNGAMVPSSAMVGWSASGRPFIKEYYLQGQSPDLVQPDANMLKIQGSPNAFVQNGALYLTFQVQLDQLSAHLIYAIGPQNFIPRSDYKLQQHRDYTASAVDFATGAVSTVSTGSLKRNHGAVNIVGWGILVPFGAITARYFRQFDPTWFYLHIAFQATGYIFAIAGVALGTSLTHKVPGVHFHRHRGIGIFVFVVASLQMLALVLRPNKEAKLRRYWNWYHHFMGSLAIFLAIVNIYYGLHIANAGDHWRVGYGIVLAIILIVVLILEAVYWYKWFKQPPLQPYPRHPQFQMQSFT
ncbi:hypothetical protein O6H91_22G013300 [Diphasiastrum complanatum]|uniref:Uncharacterized protein n=2 Tax=Diphasiastrum complanatum TaxID=34168 RepID=A0ACC2AD49_DIPCM|nr:hypothetical protein O6H91_22G013300 [Diphasiastrum complanatum]KAJ7515441.1 hypothetical protein O6H91_22G013300 [Diphasiastrum complanatum]